LQRAQARIRRARSAGKPRPAAHRRAPRRRGSALAQWAEVADNGGVKPWLFLLAHSAGAPSSHPLLKAWAARLGTLGVVETFDYPYMQNKRRAPDPQPVLVRAHLAAIEQACARHPDHELVLIGKSMGGRIGCHAALERPVSKLVCLGYPLVAPGNSEKIRDQVLLELETPILFVQGTRDPLCPLELLTQVRDKMRARNTLFVVDAGDHSLQVTKNHLKASGETQADVDQRILHVISHFLTGDSHPPNAN
jgi:predicted alpha/beta-hydrolase family hydrolase